MAQHELSPADVAQLKRLVQRLEACEAAPQPPQYVWLSFSADAAPVRFRADPEPSPELRDAQWLREFLGVPSV